MAQWLGLCTFTAEGPGSIPGLGTKIPQATWCGKKEKKKKNPSVFPDLVQSEQCPEAFSLGLCEFFVSFLFFQRGKQNFSSFVL